jgi:DNA-binding FrmR family transcriptional regulator
MPPQKKSKKSTPAETNQEDHLHDEDNEISHIPKPSNITDQQRRAKLEALQRARAEITAHILEQLPEHQTQENDDEDDDDDDDDKAIDKELEIVQQKIKQLQKEKEKFASQLQAKRKASEKLKKLNRAKGKIEAIKREIDEMKEQENSSMWQESPLQNSGPIRKTPERRFFHEKWNLTIRGS